jgi:hypothetical protein
MKYHCPWDERQVIQAMFTSKPAKKPSYVSNNDLALMKKHNVDSVESLKVKLQTIFDSGEWQMNSKLPSSSKEAQICVVCNHTVSHAH